MSQPQLKNPASTPTEEVSSPISKEQEYVACKKVDRIIDANINSSDQSTNENDFIDSSDSPLSPVVSGQCSCAVRACAGRATL